MNCPVCEDKMKEVEKNGVALDICPGCKGVWLDRGELEKLMELAADTGREAAATPGDVPRAASPQGTAPGPIPERERDSHPQERREYRDGHKRHDRDDDDDDFDFRQREHHSSDGRYPDGERKHGQYRKKESWISNVFDLFGGD